jgi:ectoine hydroxylase-related dioxygenase (phytanoyl-CoA dioxygenase family)
MLSLVRRYEETAQLPMEVGDVSWHHGWLLHSANGNEVTERSTYNYNW